MSESRNNEEDDFIEWSPWEQQTFMELQERNNQEAANFENTEVVVHKLFELFQGTAHCLAVLFKTASDGESSQSALWTSFQTAAGSVTAHHKACVEYVRSCGELAAEAGSQRRTREILTWARRKRVVRREEMLAFLAGKSPPPKTPHHYRGSPRTRISIEQRPRPRLPPSPHHHLPGPQEQDLTPFREALGITGSPASATVRRRSGHYHQELHTFLADEFNRNKRPAPSPSPPHDVTMDSPQHKRFKYT